MRNRRAVTLAALLLALTLTAAACSNAQQAGNPETPAAAMQVSAEVASADLYVNAPQRVLVGLIAQDGRVVSYGQLAFAFSYTGTVDSPTDPQPGPEATATFVPTPGMTATGDAPALTRQSEARGVYQAEDVVFDREGIWTVIVTGQVEGVGRLSVPSSLQVFDEPHLPAPGQPALETDNLTLHSKDAPKAAVDSRFTADGKIPDPELHRWTIAAAIREGVPALVVFGTPVYCASRFCGPATDAVARLAERYGDRAAFIHIEIWRDYQNQVVNRAAADWLYRDDNLTEPWLYLIAPDGTIQDRWGVVWNPEEVARELDAFPARKDLERGP